MPWKGINSMHAPVVMEYIAEQKREELARNRGQRNWKSMFRRA